MNTCTDCKLIEIEECLDELILSNGNFENGDDYEVIITDKFNNQYKFDVTAGADVLTIDLSSYKDIFNRHAGAFRMAIQDNTGAVMPFGDYLCFNLQFIDNTGNTTATIELITAP